MKWNKGSEPFYPINNEKNNMLYEKYAELAKKDNKVKFGGRLGSYRYYDMDKIIAEPFLMQNKNYVEINKQSKFMIRLKNNSFFYYPLRV
jgi:UDP-galactopyranose mutase